MNKPFDRLLYMIALRQLQATTEPVRVAYGRLEEAVGARSEPSRTVILDWLEAELARLRQTEGEDDGTASLLIREAVAFGKAVRS